MEDEIDKNDKKNSFQKFQYLQVRFQFLFDTILSSTACFT